MLTARHRTRRRQAHRAAGQNGGLSNYRPHEQPTFGPQRYPESAASQVTEGWLNIEHDNNYSLELLFSL